MALRGELDPEANVYSAYTQKNRSRVEYVALGVVVTVIVFMIPSLVRSKPPLGHVAVPSSDLVDFFSERQRANAERGVYEIGIVADLDKASFISEAEKPAWRSIFKKARRVARRRPLRGGGQRAAADH